MSGHSTRTHREHAQRLRDRVVAAGVMDRRLRRAALERDSGGSSLPEPYEALVRQIGLDSARVTDAQVNAVREAAGTEKAAFELVFAAAVGAGLRRWDAAERVITEAEDAAE